MSSQALKAGDDARKNWREINALRKEVRDLTALVLKLQGVIEGERRAADFRSAGGAGIKWRGEYTQAGIYTPNDLVKVSVGWSAGAWLCVGANSPTQQEIPGTGLKWINLGKVVDQELWF